MNERSAIIWSRSALALSLVLYVLGLFENAFSCVQRYEEQECGMNGIMALIWGIIGSVMIIKGYFAGNSWWANPVILAVWILLLLRIRAPAIVLSGVAMSLGASFLFVKVVPGGTSADSVIIGVGTGYWLWMGSMAIALLGALLLPQEKV